MTESEILQLIRRLPDAEAEGALLAIAREVEALIHRVVLGQCPHVWEYAPEPEIDDDGIAVESDYPLKRCRDCGTERSGLAFVVNGQTDAPKYLTDIAVAKQATDAMRVNAGVSLCPDGKCYSVRRAARPRVLRAASGVRNEGRQCATLTPAIPYSISRPAKRGRSLASRAGG